MKIILSSNKALENPIEYFRLTKVQYKRFKTALKEKENNKNYILYLFSIRL